MSCSYSHSVNMHIGLPDELVARIDAVADDRAGDDASDHGEIDRINEQADELNAEAEDVLEYQVIT